MYHLTEQNNQTYPTLLPSTLNPRKVQILKVPCSVLYKYSILYWKYKLSGYSILDKINTCSMNYLTNIPDFRMYIMKLS
ncbi:hypothetical protein DFQ01_1507 [Paenibacillus cellulosilyticus]|uniref:Uncharacterized protein n=1 Tax=Paenibacillus cellulosilyticus TaxID=375489 RepID=A0A2V2YJL7_9BACL|nr:hypothetical protein DFQ01_1507 [Paenibacillus cellulosilyticus]